jgi:hypothetical protein
MPPALRSGLLRDRSSYLKLAFFLLPILVFCTLLGAQAVRKPEARKPAARKLVVICISGLDQRLLMEPASRVKIPNIRKMMRLGTAAGVVGVAPSDTWPSDVALLTGISPSAANAAKQTPLWAAASNAGLKTAAVYWPGTGNAEIAFNFPAIREPRKGQNTPFDEVAQKASPVGLADRIEKTSAGFEKELWDDTSAARAAIYLLKEEQPDLLLVNFVELDSEQRETGALSVYARDMLENEDDLVGQIAAALPRGTVLALVSGNGFENENYIVRPRVLLKQGKQPWSHVEVADGLIGTADRDAADELRKLLADGRRHGLSREVPMTEAKAKAPPLGRWVAAFDTPQNYVASAENSGPALGPGSHLGVAGLWPARPGYRSVFLLSGEGIPARKLGEIDLLQIAPTLAGVIGVQLPQARSHSLWPSLAR